MTLSAILGNALSGMQASQTRVAASASNIANAETPGYKRLQTVNTAQETGGVSAQVEEVGEAGRPDELSDMVGLIQGSQSFAANAKAFETGADMWTMLLSIRRD